MWATHCFIKMGEIQPHRLSLVITTDSKVHGAHMGPTWVLSAPDGPHVGPMNLAIRDNFATDDFDNLQTSYDTSTTQITLSCCSFSLWRHQMETRSALLALCTGNYSLHKGQLRGALMFSLICAWINGSVTNRDTGDLRHHRAHYDVIATSLLLLQVKSLQLIKVKHP